MVTLTNSKNQKLIFWYSSTNIHIKDSFKIPTADMEEWLKLIRAYIQKTSGYHYLRTNSSWIAEWKAHNLLYDCRFKRNRTADVDLNEDEPSCRKNLYSVLSVFYTK